MSMGFDFLQSSPSDQGIDLDIGDLKLQYNAALEELNFVSVSFESYMDACNRVFALFDAVEANEGMLDPVVRDFVNRNGELSMALGIDLAMEDDSQDAQKQNGEKVQEKKQGFFRRIWEAIKAFIKKILDGIGNFFHWLGSFFSANSKKIDDISKNADQIVDKAKEPVQEAFSETTGYSNSMNAEVIMADPKKTENLLYSYSIVIDATNESLKAFNELIKPGQSDIGATFARVRSFLYTVVQYLKNQKEKGTNLVDFKIEIKTIKDKQGKVKNFNRTAEEFDYPYITIIAPRRISFKSPNAKSILSAYAALGWIEKPVLTRSFKDMEEYFHKCNTEISETLQVFKELDKRTSSGEFEQTVSGIMKASGFGDDMHTNHLDISDIGTMLKMYGQMVGKLAATYGTFYKKFGKMLDDIHSVIDDRPKQSNQQTGSSSNHDDNKPEIQNLDAWRAGQ